MVTYRVVIIVPVARLRFLLLLDFVAGIRRRIGISQSRLAVDVIRPISVLNLIHLFPLLLNDRVSALLPLLSHQT